AETSIHADPQIGSQQPRHLLGRARIRGTERAHVVQGHDQKRLHHGGYREVHLVFPEFLRPYELALDQILLQLPGAVEVELDGRVDDVLVVVAERDQRTEEADVVQDLACQTADEGLEQLAGRPVGIRLLEEPVPVLVAAADEIRFERIEEAALVLESLIEDPDGYTRVLREIHDPRLFVPSAREGCHSGFDQALALLPTSLLHGGSHGCIGSRAAAAARHSSYRPQRCYEAKASKFNMNAGS